MPTIYRRPFFPAWLWCALAWSLSSSPTTAAETADNKASRLGFKFDQAAHDAATAGTPAADRPEPLPPGVIRLPRYRVTTQALPQGDQMLTPKGRIVLAEKRYETDFYRAVIGPLEAIASFLNNPLGGWSPNAPEALALYEDEQRKRRATEMNDLLDLAALADSAKKTDARRENAKKPSK